MSRGDRGLCLDLDGTLAGSLEVLREVYARFLRARGVHPTEGGFDLLNGLPLRSVVTQLKEEHRLGASAEDLERDYRTELEVGHRETPPAAGARALLDAARRGGVPVAVVTSSPTTTAESWLQRHGLRDRVATVVGGEGPGPGKPSPEPYLEALRRLRCRAERSVAVEDSPIGAAAAVAAGLRTYVIGTSPPDPRGWPGVHGFVACLDELSGWCDGV